TGVHLRLGQEALLEATDRYRVARTRLDWDPADDEAEAAVLAPAKDLAYAAKTLADGAVDLGLTDAGMLALGGPDRQVLLRGLGDGFPDLDKLLGGLAEADTVVEAETGALAAAVRRAAALAAPA